jgi:hypothetical protein
MLPKGEGGNLYPQALVLSELFKTVFSLYLNERKQFIVINIKGA